MARISGTLAPPPTFTRLKHLPAPAVNIQHPRLNLAVSLLTGGVEFVYGGKCKFAQRVPCE